MLISGALLADAGAEWAELERDADSGWCVCQSMHQHSKPQKVHCVPCSMYAGIDMFHPLTPAQNVSNALPAEYEDVDYYSTSAVADCAVRVAGFIPFISKRKVYGFPLGYL